MLGLEEEHEHKPGLTPIQSWKDFFTRFSMPPFSWEPFHKRIVGNILQFHLNYMILSAFVIFLNALFFSYYMLFVVPLIAACWWYVFFKNPGDFYSKMFNFRVRKNYMAIFMTIVLLWGSIVISGNYWSAYYYTSISGVLVMIHAILKGGTPPKKEVFTTTESTRLIDPESIRSVTEEDKRERQQQVRSRLREKYGLDK